MEIHDMMLEQHLNNQPKEQHGNDLHETSTTTSAGPSGQQTTAVTQQNRARHSGELELESEHIRDL